MIEELKEVEKVGDFVIKLIGIDNAVFEVIIELNRTTLEVIDFWDLKEAYLKMEELQEKMIKENILRGLK